MSEATDNEDAVKAWAKKKPRERELLEALHGKALGRRPDVDVAACKFLLANLWPSRWAITPHPTKRSPLDEEEGSEAAAATTTERDPSFPPYDLKCVG